MKTKILIISLMCFFVYNTMSQQLGKVSYKEFQTQDTCIIVNKTSTVKIKPGAVKLWYDENNVMNGVLTFQSNRKQLHTTVNLYGQLEREVVTVIEESEIGTVKNLKLKGNNLKFKLKFRDPNLKPKNFTIPLSERDKKTLKEFIQ